MFVTVLSDIVFANCLAQKTLEYLNDFDLDRERFVVVHPFNVVCTVAPSQNVKDENGAKLGFLPQRLQNKPIRANFGSQA